MAAGFLRMVYRARPKRMGRRRRFYNTIGRKRYYVRRRFIRGPRNELKTYDSTASSVSCTNTGSFIGITAGIAQGTAEGQRIGQSINVKSLQLRYIVDAKQGAPETDPFYNRVRLLVLLDKQSNTGTSAVSSILEDPANPIVSPLEKDSYLRYTVLHDAVIALDYDDPSFVGKFFKRMNIPVRYASGTAIPQSNNVVAMVISDQADDYPVMNYYFRVRYTDS